MYLIMTQPLARARMEELHRRVGPSPHLPVRERRTGPWRRLMPVLGRPPTSCTPRRAI